MKIVIRTEAGKEIGYGHLIRSLALARALHASIHVETDVEQYLVRSNGIGLGDEKDADVLIRDMWSHYPRARGGLLTIDIVDEVHERSREADLTFSIYGATAMLPTERVYSGLNHAIIRPEFLKQPAVERKGVLVTLGGTDASNSTQRICTMLQRLSPRILDERRRIWSQLAAAKVVVTSAGMTMLEAALLGTPAVVMSHNMREHCRIMELKSIWPGIWFDYLGPHQTIQARELEEAVNALLADALFRDLRSNMGRQAVDGKGLLRVVKVIEFTASYKLKHFA